MGPEWRWDRRQIGLIDTNHCYDGNISRGVVAHAELRSMERERDGNVTWEDDMTAEWRCGVPAQAFLVAFDISGFSRDQSPDVLLQHRTIFIEAINTSGSYIPGLARKKLVHVHFLGDEVRLAVLAHHDPGEIRTFAFGVHQSLRKLSPSGRDVAPTRVRGVIMAGPVKWQVWNGCHFLGGPLPFRAEAWMRCLAPDELAIDEAFKSYLDTHGRQATLMSRDFASERGYVLTMDEE